MKHSIDYQTSCNTKRWIAYFDLLGITRLVKSGDWPAVFEALSRSVEELKRHNHYDKEVSIAWFSDTFIVYVQDDSLKSFSAVSTISRFFSFYLLQASIPLRGAIACDWFYADHTNSIFFGQGLVEAYEYGEAQDWIGIILCPSAEDKLRGEEELINSLDFISTDIPYKTKGRFKHNLPACILGTWSNDGRNECLGKIREMLTRIDSSEVAKKYQKTIEFLEKYVDRWKEVERGSDNLK